MNHPTTHGGYTFYQSEYRQDPTTGRTMSILSVSRDPGQPIVFAGYVGMLVGMIWVLVLRVLDRKRAAAPKTVQLGMSRPAGKGRTK
jgi:cytochrome c biogenesis protein ResB